MVFSVCIMYKIFKFLNVYDRDIFCLLSKEFKNYKITDVGQKINYKKKINLNGYINLRTNVIIFFRIPILIKNIDNDICAKFEKLCINCHVRSINDESLCSRFKNFNLKKNRKRNNLKIEYDVVPFKNKKKRLMSCMYY